jgi:hypothetical protein
MPIYTPPDISGGIKDLWDYIRVDRPHRWPALGLAITIPGVVFFLIADDLRPEPEGRRIVYVQSWPADRSEFDVRRDWLNRALRANDENQARREAAGAMAGAIGQTFDKARSDREFDEARATIRQALADLDAAEAAGQPLPALPRSEPETPNAAARPAAPATR